MQPNLSTPDPLHFPLPVSEYREKILSLVGQANRLILAAPPGSGKSTCVPRFFLEDGRWPGGKIVVLQPRRIAARNLAMHIASELGESAGATVGYQVRFESKIQDSTRIIFQTYGVFFQQLLHHPFLEGISLILFDEFHERTLEADAALAWVKELQKEKRKDLKFIVMSATLESGALAAYLESCPVLDIPARTFPVEVLHQAPMQQEAMWQQAFRAFKNLYAQGLDGSVLVFMPGAGEIRKTAEILDPFCRSNGWKVYELHGSMEVDAQQNALAAPAREQCIIISTNIAETSLTIPGIRAVIDSGLARLSAYNPQRDLNTLYLGSISLQNATQRTGRAGRTGPGLCVRLWAEAREKAMPIALEPEIRRLDLVSLVLAVRSLFQRLEKTTPPSMGQLADVQSTLGERFWLTPPNPEMWGKAEHLLRDLEALTDSGFLSPLGERLLRLPVHPRSGRILADAEAKRVVNVTAAMIAVMESMPRRGKADSSDLFAAGADLARNPGASYWDRETREAFRQLLRLANPAREEKMAGEGEERVREVTTKCWMPAYKDRIAVRVEKTNSFLLSDGRKGVLAAGADRVRFSAQVILAMEMHETGGSNQSRQVSIPLFLPCESAWVLDVFPGECEWRKVSGWDADKKRAVREERLHFNNLILERRSLPTEDADPEQAEYLLVEKLLSKEITLPAWDDGADQLLRRVVLTGRTYPEYGIPVMDEEDWRLLYHEICHKKSSLRELEPVLPTRALKDYLGPLNMDFIDKVAPDSLKLPSGRTAKITYFEGAPPEISARLADFIGMEGKAYVLEGKVEALFNILAPNYRTVQKTSDMTSFWKNTYPEVKKELQRRYPKHPWP